MVFHMGDKNNRPVFLLQTIGSGKPSALLHSQDPLEFYHSGSHAKTGCDDHIILTGIYMLLNELMGIVVGLGHQGASFTRLCMRIAHPWPDCIPDLILNRAIQPATGYPVGIENPPCSIRRFKGGIVSYDALSKRLEIFL